MVLDFNVFQLQISLLFNSIIFIFNFISIFYQFLIYIQLKQTEVFLLINFLIQIDHPLNLQYIFIPKSRQLSADPFSVIQKSQQQQKIQNHQPMIKSYKSSLNLNSYKLDTKTYEEKLKELSAENQELKSIIYSNKSKQGGLYEQLKNNKLEVNTLRNLLKSQYVVHQNKCKNCATFSMQSMNRIVNELQAEKIKAKQYKTMYENQVQNKKDLTEYYEKKMHAILRDKDILIKKYQQKIRTSSKSSFQSQNIESATSIQNHSPLKKSQLRADSTTILQESPIQRVNKKYPPSPPKSNNFIPSFKQKSKQVSDSSLRKLLTPILERLTKMQISFEQLRCIPQIQRFSQLSNPPKNRYIKLMRDFPFQCQDEDDIESSYEYIIYFIQQKVLQYNGDNIMNILIGKMEQL